MFFHFLNVQRIWFLSFFKTFYSFFEIISFQSRNINIIVAEFILSSVITVISKVFKDSFNFCVILLIFFIWSKGSTYKADCLRIALFKSF